jgi:hypothetical protein
MEARGDLKPIPGRKRQAPAAAAPPKPTGPKPASPKKPAEGAAKPKAAKEEPRKGLLGRPRGKKEE